MKAGLEIQPRIYSTSRDVPLGRLYKSLLIHREVVVGGDVVGQGEVL